MNHKRKQLMALALTVALLAPSVSAVEYSGSDSYEAGPYYQALVRVSLTGERGKDLAKVALSQVGYQEGDHDKQLAGVVYGKGNYTEYGRWYGNQSDWAATFVSWCASRANVPKDVIPSHCDIGEGLDWFVTRGAAYSRMQVQTGKYTPIPGDLIYFKSGKNAKPVNHVGIITGFSGGKIYTVEADSRTEGSVTNGGMVVQRCYPITNEYIVYICAPDFGTVSTNVATHRVYGGGLLKNNDWHRHILPEKYLIRIGDRHD